MQRIIKRAERIRNSILLISIEAPVDTPVQAQDGAIVAVSLNSPTRTDALYGRLFSENCRKLYEHYL